MPRIPPSVRRFLDIEACIEDDDEERNSEEEEGEEEDEQAHQSALSFSLNIKYRITNYILQIISLTIVLQISQTPNLTNLGTTLSTITLTKRSLAIS
jgi:hypothetical protein